MWSKETKEEEKVVLPPSKLMRTESTAVVPLPSSQLTRTMSEEDNGVTESAVEKTHPSSDEPRARKVPAKRTLDEAAAKLSKENGAAIYIPLSIGRNFDDLWWEPLSVEPVRYEPGKRAYGVGNLLLLTVRLFWNCGDPTLDSLLDTRAIRQFKISPYEALLIGYLRARYMKDIQNIKKDMSFEEWKAFMTKKYGKEGDDPVTFAKRVMDEVLKQEIPKLPVHFSLYFQKKPLTVFSDIDSYLNVQNRNLIKGKAEKADFEYEIRISLFYTSPPEKEVKKEH